MDRIQKISRTTVAFTCITALVQTAAFLIESVLWRQPYIYEKVIAALNVAPHVSPADQANILDLLFFSQGFYNLFIVLGAIAGLLLIKRGQVVIGVTLIGYTCLFTFGAGVVLAVSTGAYTVAAIQGGPPLIALISLRKDLQSHA